jgi:hypothetical protein
MVGHGGVDSRRALIAWAFVIPSLLPIATMPFYAPVLWFRQRTRLTLCFLVVIGAGTVLQSLFLTTPSFCLLAGFIIWQYNVEIVPLAANFLISCVCTCAYAIVASKTLDASTIGWHVVLLVLFLIGLLPPTYEAGCVGRQITNLSFSMSKEHRMLSKEEKRGTALLHSLLPKQVVVRMQQNPTALIADSYDNVSVLFTDMKGFTKFSSSVTPSELVAFLNQMFSRFDAISEEHGIYKVCI